MRAPNAPKFRLQFPLTEVMYWTARYAYADDAEAEAIGKAARERGWYTRDEFLTVARWKTPRSKRRCEENDGSLVKAVTQLALSTPSRTMGFEMKGTLTVMEVEPMRLLHIRSDSPMDVFYRFKPEGDSTLLTVEGDYEMPGHIPGFIKNLITKSWVERHMRQQLADIKALAEATLPVPA